MKWNNIRRDFLIIIALSALIFCMWGCMRGNSSAGLQPEEKPASKESPGAAQLLADGKRHLEHEDFENAEKLLSEALKASPGSAEIHYELGRVFSETDRNSEAEKEIKEAVKLKPDYAGAYSTLGYVYLHMKRFEEAKESFDRAINLDAGLVDAYIGLSSLYYACREYDQAVGVLEKAKKINSDEPYIYMNLGLV